MAEDTNVPGGQTVKANGLDMYYEEAGSGPPLILIHGGTAVGSSWRPHIPAFEKHFRVIMPDSRAHGRTNNPGGELTYSLMADDFAAFAQALGLTKPLIFGYSDGGQTALEIGMRYPRPGGRLRHWRRDLQILATVLCCRQFVQLHHQRQSRYRSPRAQRTRMGK